ncbi:PGN_0703 family putative restriction endonuclease [Sphingomonas crocodyli]|uniref:PD-(D/E)XK nuclease-like domain-containing protein n=1 Tax=Sphingomonas crocodyli TaxID=1979270 RepID=A0A437M6V1_9SPHN|nr:hypothetical protein [Sphingomonas crocodyli]RVT93438.1 hypothetical protein EOD43_06055 [Sphingomonas crocodyli]
MSQSTRPVTAPLPIVPVELLKRFHVHERHDSRLKACARLLQVLWLTDHKIPTGYHQGRNGPRRLGSRLSITAAQAGRNFLSPDLANLAQHVVAYQEPGAFIDAGRVFANALGSTGLSINVMGMLALDLGLAARVLCQLFPELNIASVDHIRFEHSPGRADPTLTGDRSAFDVCAFVNRRQGRKTKPAVIAFEFKYTESLHDSAACTPGHYDDLAEASGLFKDPQHAALRVNPLQQLFREHLLAQATVMRGDWPEAIFVSIAPAAHDRAQRQADFYTAFLNPPTDGQVPYRHLTLEAFVTALHFAGASNAAQALFERYLDWGRIDRAVAQALHKRVEKWTPVPKPAPLQLVDTPRAA